MKVCQCEASVKTVNAPPWAKSIAACAALGSALWMGGSAHAVTHVYSFESHSYTRVIDSAATAIRYSTSMALSVDLMLAAPLAPGLEQSTLSPMSLGFDDGVHRETAVSLDRFNGWVSTDRAGLITDFLVQVFLDAPNSPGVWIRRTGDDIAYKATLSQWVVAGHRDPCHQWTVCEGEPIYEWVTDRAEGSAGVSVFARVGAIVPPQAEPSDTTPVPGPVPGALLVAALASLAVRARRRQ